MPGLGTIVNVLLIAVGGLIGLLAGKRIPARFQETILAAINLSVMVVGLGGILEKMLVPAEGGLISQGSFMMILSLVLGAAVGEIINIERQFERFGTWLKEKTGSSGDAGFISAFVDASLIVSIGAMAVLGSINDGIYGDHTVLFTKGLLDFVIIQLLAGSRGKGCIFAAIPVGVFQGCMTALSRLIEPILTAQALSNLALVGSVMIFTLGINMVFDKHIRVANFLPSIVFAVVFAFL